MTHEQMNYEFDYEPEEHTATETDSGEEPEFEIFDQARPEQEVPEEAHENEVDSEVVGSEEAPPEEAKLEEINSEKARGLECRSRCS